MSMKTVTCHFGHKERVWFATGFKRPPHQCQECSRIEAARRAAQTVTDEPAPGHFRSAELDRPTTTPDYYQPAPPYWGPPPEPVSPEFIPGGEGDFGGGGATGGW